MSLDLTRLEKVKNRSANIIARCPACAEMDVDRKGQHLFINQNGQFGCVLYPGREGHQHRQRIFELAGNKKNPSYTGTPPNRVGSNQHQKFITVNKQVIQGSPPNVIQSDILGRLGCQYPSFYKDKNKSAESLDKTTNTKDSEIAVPKVPTFTNEEILKGLDLP